MTPIEAQTAREWLPIVFEGGAYISLLLVLYFSATKWIPALLVGARNELQHMQNIFQHETQELSAQFSKEMQAQRKLFQDEIRQERASSNVLIAKILATHEAISKDTLEGFKDAIGNCKLRSVSKGGIEV